MKNVVISGTGLFVPEDTITNDELVRAYNLYVAEQKGQGINPPPEESSTAFIVKASGILQRHVLNKSGILDPQVMMPRLPSRSNEDWSYQCEMSVAAARMALKRAGKTPEQVEAVIVACSNMERPYPAIAIEIQAALQMKGFAFDLNVACSSATFGIQVAKDMIAAGSAKTVLMVNPEICSAHLDFRDRDSHFIFGDACTAVLMEEASAATTGPSGPGPFRILGSSLATLYSNNIRNNFGFMNRTCPETQFGPDKLFKQNGRKVFKEVVPLVAHHILGHLEDLKLSPLELKRFWLHQANKSMNDLIAHKILGRDPTPDEAPDILKDFANTSSAGSIIAFHLHHEDLKKGDRGVICSFGAGYSVGSVVVERL